MKFAAISQRVDEAEGYNETRDALDEQWHGLFRKMDTLLLPVPNVPGFVEMFLSRARPDAIVLSGGNSPVPYGGTAPQRDGTDEALIQYAIRNNVPLLGVCRGMQSIALHFGGVLKEVGGHVGTRHWVGGEFSREVNSYHRFAVGSLGDGLQALAQSKDGAVEAIKHKGYPIYGIMWHPERAGGFDARDIGWIAGRLRLRQP